MEIDSTENSNWLFDYPIPIVDPTTTIADYPLPANSAGFTWPTLEAFPDCCNVGVEIGCSYGNLDCPQEVGSHKRLRSETCVASGSKACREKLRRDRLNERFVELSSILDPGKPVKTDKTAILRDAVRMVTQLRLETNKLKDMNQDLQEKIKVLKAEKNELREEKQGLKAEKEKLEQQIKSISAQPRFVPHASAISAAGNKLLPFVGYHGVAMWQFMPPAVVDTSQDHVLRSPVA